MAFPPMPSRATTPGRPTLRQGKARQKMFGVRPPGATAGEILPVPPLIKEGTQKPPFVKGAARSAGGFGHVAVMKRTFASSIANVGYLLGKHAFSPSPAGGRGNFFAEAGHDA